MPAKPRVAVLATCVFPNSHADVILSRLLAGYEWPPGSRERTDARIEVASLHLDQVGGAWEVDRGPEIGRALADRHGIRLALSIADAMLDPDTGELGIDGVVIIGEHGDYPLDAKGQKLYPRRRIFDSALAVMEAIGRAVPVFTDKHLATEWTDAVAMVAAAERLGVPVLAGSSLPFTWRVPTTAHWEQGAGAEKAVVVFYGPLEAYGFHALEGIEALLEARGVAVEDGGGPEGVSRVETAGPEGLTHVDAPLLELALRAADPSADDAVRAAWLDSVQTVATLTHTDGLVVDLVRIDTTAADEPPPTPFAAFAAAVSGADGRQLALRWHLPGAPFDHFTLLVRQIESLVLEQASPVPIERTLLTTGVLAALMESVATGHPVTTPWLELAWPPSEPTDTAVGSEVPPHLP